MTILWHLFWSYFQYSSLNCINLQNFDFFPPYFSNIHSSNSSSTSKENMQLVADEPVEVQEFKKFTDPFRRIYTIYLKWIKQNRNMSLWNRSDLETLRSWPVMLKNSPATDSHISHKTEIHTSKMYRRIHPSNEPMQPKSLENWKYV